MASVNSRFHLLKILFSSLHLKLFDIAQKNDKNGAIWCIQSIVEGLEPQGGGGGGTLIFSHIRRLGPFFGFKILNFNIFFGFSEK